MRTQNKRIIFFSFGFIYYGLHTCFYYYGFVANYEFFINPLIWLAYQKGLTVNKLFKYCLLVAFQLKVILHPSGTAGLLSKNKCI